MTLRNRKRIEKTPRKTAFSSTSSVLYSTQKPLNKPLHAPSSNNLHISQSNHKHKNTEESSNAIKMVSQSAPVSNTPTNPNLNNKNAKQKANTNFEMSKKETNSSKESRPLINSKNNRFSIAHQPKSKIHSLNSVNLADNGSGQNILPPKLFASKWFKSCSQKIGTDRPKFLTPK